MARDLYSRLKRLKEISGVTQGLPPLPGHSAGPATPGSADPERRAGESPRNHEALADTLTGWSQLAPLVFSRTTVVPVDGPKAESMHSRLLGRNVRFQDLCFMDTETTGLSGGAGTSVFLVGAGFCRSGSVHVEQVLLADFPGEPEFLSVVRDRLWSAGIWVSYNGKSFDSRLLETRFLMNGQQVVIPDQLDLLYWSRRLWKSRIGSCSLSSIEREILRDERVGDVDSFEIPDRYFEFLKTGDPEGLNPVFSHHLQDIVSLVRLFCHLEGILEQAGLPECRTATLEVDRVSLGRYLVSRRQAGGQRLLEDVITRPLPEEELRDRERAAFALARSLRRSGRADEMVEFWRTLWEAGSIPAGVEYAKHLEHRARDIRAALDLAGEILMREMGDRLRADVRRRLLRLERKSAN